ncbi:MAG: threonine/serine exporter family protein, partial [Clostridia bacterium]|nr:threonine/serine exporter family protein [Clostridia bacterium]
YKPSGYPRLSLTVPSIVIMVPGLFLYRGIYLLGLTNLAEGGLRLTKAVLIILALPLGLVIARILTDPYFRHSS